jgi:hypothetical protein
MKTYTVYRRRSGGDMSDAARSPSWRRRLTSQICRLFRGEPEALVLVKEGLCWPAAAFTIAWAIWHRLWAFAIGILVIGTALGAVIDALDPDPVRDVTLIVCYLVLVGFHANDARRRALVARDYEFVGIVLGRSTDGAQLRYLAGTAAVSEGDRP